MINTVSALLDKRLARQESAIIGNVLDRRHLGFSDATHHLLSLQAVPMSIIKWV